MHFRVGNHLRDKTCCVGLQVFPLAGGQRAPSVVGHMNGSSNALLQLAPEATALVELTHLRLGEQSLMELLPTRCQVDIEGERKRVRLSLDGYVFLELGALPV